MLTAHCNFIVGNAMRIWLFFAPLASRLILLLLLHHFSVFFLFFIRMFYCSLLVVVVAHTITFLYLFLYRLTIARISCWPQLVHSAALVLPVSTLSHTYIFSLFLFILLWRPGILHTHITHTHTQHIFLSTFVFFLFFRSMSVVD